MLKRIWVCSVVVSLVVGCTSSHARDGAAAPAGSSCASPQHADCLMQGGPVHGGMMGSGMMGSGGMMGCGMMGSGMMGSGMMGSGMTDGKAKGHDAVNGTHSGQDCPMMARGAPAAPKPVNSASP